MMQSLEEQAIVLIKKLKEKGYDSQIVINELLNEIHIKKESPIAT